MCVYVCCVCAVGGLCTLAISAANCVSESASSFSSLCSCARQLVYASISLSASLISRSRTPRRVHAVRSHHVRSARAEAC